MNSLFRSQHTWVKKHNDAVHLVVKQTSVKQLHSFLDREDLYK